jgi:hypothetical protein
MTFKENPQVDESWHVHFRNSASDPNPQPKLHNYQ